MYEYRHVDGYAYMYEYCVLGASSQGLLVLVLERRKSDFFGFGLLCAA